MKFEKIADRQFKKSKTKMADKPSTYISSSGENKYKYKINTHVDDFIDFEDDVDSSFD